MTDEEKKEYEKLKSLLYTGTISQYGKRKLIEIIEKQSKEIEELKEDKYGLEEEVQIQAKNIMLCENALCEIQDKIKAKIGERMQKNNNIIHNAKLKYGKDYYWYDDVQEAKRENDIYKEVLQSLLEKE